MFASTSRFCHWSEHIFEMKCTCSWGSSKCHIWKCNRTHHSNICTKKRNDTSCSAVIIRLNFVKHVVGAWVCILLWWACFLQKRTSFWQGTCISFVFFKCPLCSVLSLSYHGWTNLPCRHLLLWIQDCCWWQSWGYSFLLSYISHTPRCTMGSQSWLFRDLVVALCLGCMQLIFFSN